MNFFHICLALILVAIWGFNFVFIQFALTDMSALMLCTVRFFLASFPALFLFKPPKTSWYLLFSYAILIFVLQFLLLFAGIKAGVTPGLAGLLVQVQVFFSIFFAAIILKEKVNYWQIIGACIAFSGVGVVLFHVGGDVSILGLFLIIAASISWGAGSMIIKKIGSVDPMGLVIWGSFIAFIPLLILCLLIEGPKQMVSAMTQISLRGWLSTAYITYASTWIGYGLWNWLLARYVMSMVVPFTFLVPIFAMLGSVLVLGETLYTWKIWAAALVITGLVTNLFGGKFKFALRNEMRKG